jgi:hypothetical protein
LEKNLKRADIRLESFLISQTNRNQLRWPSPNDAAREATPKEYKERHILLAKDEPETYVQEMIAEMLLP